MEDSCAMAAATAAPPPASDREFLEAEQLCLSLQACLDQVPEDSPEDEWWGATVEKQCAVMEWITITPPAGVAGALVKLRLMAHPSLGLEGGKRVDDPLCLRQVLAAIEGHFRERRS